MKAFAKIPNRLLMILIISLFIVMRQTLPVNAQGLTSLIQVQITDISWHYTGELIAISTANGVEIIDVNTSIQLTTLHSDSFIWSVEWHPNGEFLALTQNKNVEIWEHNPATNEFSLITTLVGQVDFLNVVWSPGGNWLASMTEQNVDPEAGISELARIYIWNTATWQLQAQTTPSFFTNQIEYSTADIINWHPDNSKMLVTDSSSGARVIDAQTGNELEILTFGGSTSPIYTALWYIEENAIIIGGDSGAIMYDTVGENFFKSVSPIEVFTVDNLALSPSGQYLMVDADLVYIGDTSESTTQFIGYFPTQGHVKAVEWNPDGTKIAIGTDEEAFLADPTIFPSFIPPSLCDTSVPAGDTVGLISAINSANANPDATSICLANGIYTFTAANNSTNALPVISSEVTILGNGATLVRSSSSNFRFFTVNSGGHLTLENITLTGGSVGSQYGGALHINGGQLTLNNATIHPNLCR